MQIRPYDLIIYSSKTDLAINQILLFQHYILIIIIILVETMNNKSTYNEMSSQWSYKDHVIFTLYWSYFKITVLN